MIYKTESGRVSKEIPGSGSGSGTRWALAESDNVKIMRREMKIMLKRDKRKIGRQQGADQRRCNQTSFSLAFVLLLLQSGFVLSLSLLNVAMCQDLFVTSVM